MSIRKVSAFCGEPIVHEILTLSLFSVLVRCLLSFCLETVTPLVGQCTGFLSLVYVIYWMSARLTPVSQSHR